MIFRVVEARLQDLVHHKPVPLIVLRDGGIQRTNAARWQFELSLVRRQVHQRNIRWAGNGSGEQGTTDACWQVAVERAVTDVLDESSKRRPSLATLGPGDCG